MKTYEGHIVDVVRHKIYDGTLSVEDGRITEVRQCQLPEKGKPWPYVMPGFIDSHVHIESSMMVPQEFAHIAVTHGTIGVIADPHEIGNVLGAEGVDFMIDSGRQAQFNFCFGAPSCVPAVGGEVETSGGTIDSRGIEKLMARDDIGFLGEMMNYPGVLAGDPEVMSKICAARRHGKPVDGHAPGLTGHLRDLYTAAGITTEHECTTLDEGHSCINAGMKVIIREGSAAKDYERLSPLIGESPNMVMLCTDDCHPDDLVRGHINAIVKRALADGYDLWNVLQAACVNPQKHYNLSWGLLQQGDPATFIMVDSLDPHFKVENTIIRGKEVFSLTPNINDNEQRKNAEKNRNTRKNGNENESYRRYSLNSFVAAPITAKDLFLDMHPGDTVHIIHAADGSLLTGHDEITLTGNPLTDFRYPWTEVQKIVVYNRYVRGAKPIVGLVRGFGIREGAIAGSVAHDCHNIVAIGSSDELLARAINRIIEMQGGQVVVSPVEMLDIPLPIAGLMTPMNGYEIAFRTTLLHEMVRSIGCTMKSPFITMAFMALPVIPEIKITDCHLMDTKNMQIIK